MRKLFRIVFTIAALASFEASAAGSCDTLSSGASSEPEIYFINGINNSPKEAVKSLDGLCQTMSRYGIKNIRASVLYNPKGALDIAPASFDDIGELVLQAQISADTKAEVELLGNPKENYLANLTPLEKYYYNLGRKYIYGKDDASGDYIILNDDYKVFGTVRDGAYYVIQQLVRENKNVILFAHSQGNFVAEAIYATIFAQSKDPLLPKLGISSEQYADALKRLRIVGAAPVSAKSPHNNYILLAQDLAVNAMMTALLRPGTLKYFSTLETNALLCELIGNTCSVFDAFDREYSTWKNLKLAIFTGKNGHGFDKFYNSENFRIQQTGVKTAEHLVSLISKALVELQKPVLPQVLYSHYKFDNNIADSIISPRTPLVHSTGLPSFTTRGTSPALRLPFQQYLAHRSGMLVPGMRSGGTHSFTVATWVKFDAWAAQTNAIAYERQFGGLDGACNAPIYGLSNYFNFGGRKWLFLIGTKNDQGQCINEQLWSTVDASLGQWYHVAATYDQTTGQTKMYVNGQVVAEKTVAKQLNLPNDPYLSVGQQPWAEVSQSLNGAVDDLRFYQGALSLAEVQLLAEGASPLPVSTSCSSPVKSVPFTENFTSPLDPLKWAVSESGGSVLSGSGSLTLSTVGAKSQFPSIATVSDVIPASGNFSLFCRAKYSAGGPYGAGACVATRNLVDASASANYGGYIGVWGGGGAVYMWGFDVGNTRLYYAPLSSGITDTHDYETCVINGEVTAYVDGNLVARATVPVDRLRPRRVWLGHPGSAASPNTWVTIETSKIEVRQLQ